MGKHVHIVGAFEAKTHLADLLRRVDNGEEFVIERRGRPVARLIPYSKGARSPTLAETVEEMRSVRSGLKGPFDIRELISEGRHE
ncbi:MAG: type II toxin-antitoxin system prevent-host-death family antitoxin [Deltaproteobacteria bacterium]|nr:type II toxin-antitoxin system prevent-host-death family antitoxin [Deltaproteobacteria bacterium]